MICIVISDPLWLCRKERVHFCCIPYSPLLNSCFFLSKKKATCIDKFFMFSGQSWKELSLQQRHKLWKMACAKLLLLQERERHSVQQSSKRALPVALIALTSLAGWRSLLH